MFCCLHDNCQHPTMITIISECIEKLVNDTSDTITTTQTKRLKLDHLCRRCKYYTQRYCWFSLHICFLIVSHWKWSVCRFWSECFLQLGICGFYWLQWETWVMKATEYSWRLQLCSRASLIQVDVLAKADIKFNYFALNAIARIFQID